MIDFESILDYRIFHFMTKFFLQLFPCRGLFLTVVVVGHAPEASLPRPTSGPARRHSTESTNQLGVLPKFSLRVETLVGIGGAVRFFGLGPEKGDPQQS